MNVIEMRILRWIYNKPKKDKIQPPPIPSSGLHEIDLLASLVGIDESVEGALILWNQLDLESIYAMIHQLNELRRPAEERINEHLDDQYQQWKSQNQDFYSQLGKFEKSNG